MKKRILAMVLALVMVCALLPATALAADSDFTIKNGVLTKYKGSGGDVVIPSTVTAIGENAFAYCDSLTGVTIPNSVTSIGEDAFMGCAGLTSITIPDSVTVLGREAFGGCYRLTSVTIPGSVTTIGQNAFGGCSSLTSVTIPGSVTTIGDSAFSSCASLTSVTIPDSVTEIGSYAFKYCGSLTSVTIPDSVTSIGNCTFHNCKSLTSVTIPNSVTSIGLMAFCECAHLTSVTIPDSVTTIGQMAFFKCTGLTDVYYGGTESQWKAVEIAPYNDPLNSATIHCDPDPAPAPGDKGEAALTEALVRERIEALKSQYPEGMSWTNDNSYFSKVFNSTGSGCAGFAFLCSDTAFGDAPIVETHSSFDKIRVGDVLRINNDTHSVVVLEKRANSVIVTEGNFNRSIHWGREVSRAELEEGGLKVTTRWSVPAQEEPPAETPAPAPVTPAAYTASPTNDKLSVDGGAATPTAYKISGSNYFKLRDVAALLNGSAKEFDVGYDSATKSVTITTGKGYAAQSGDLRPAPAGKKEATVSNNAVYIDGVKVELTVYKIDGNNYFMLRDLGQKLGFNVGWESGRGMFIETDKSYDPSN